MRLDRWFRRRWPAMGLSHPQQDLPQGRGARRRQARGGVGPLKTGNVVRIPPIKIDVEAPAVKRAADISPHDAKLIRDITLFEDRKLMVLNKPYGLAVQGGSGTTRHIDGMLQAMAEEMGERPVLVHRLDRDTSGVLLIRQDAQDGGGSRRNLPLAPGAQDLLVHRAGRAEAAAGTHLAVPGEGRGHG